MRSGTLAPVKNNKAQNNIRRKNMCMLQCFGVSLQMDLLLHGTRGSRNILHLIYKGYKRKQYWAAQYQEVLAQK